jgi:hypothetical protein
MDHNRSSLTLEDGTTLRFPYNDGSSLPLMLTTKHFGNNKDNIIGLTYQDAQSLGDTDGLQALTNAINETNQNLTPAQK